MDWCRLIKYVVKKLSPQFLLEIYWKKNREVGTKTRFFDDVSRRSSPEVYGSEPPSGHSDLLWLERKYNTVVICWLPVWIIGHCCTVYHYAYQRMLKERSEETCYLIVPNTRKLAVGQQLPNKYLYRKFTEQMPAAINPKIAWHDYIQKYPQRLLLLDTEETDDFYFHAAKSYFQGMWGELLIPFDLPSVMFSQQEIDDGQQVMRELGIEKNFICIFARDSAYYSEIEADPNFARNFDIDNFKQLAMEFYECHDMQAVRMGARVNKGISCKGVVDYASLGRTEFMDVFLFSQTEFYIGNSSGIECIARLFSKPIVAVDFPCVLPIDEPTMPYHLLIYAKWYSEEKQRCLTLRELIHIQVELKIQNMEKHGLDAFLDYATDHLNIIHNSPQEILDVAEEMYDILHGTVQYTCDDELRQKMYRDIIHSETKQFNNITGVFGRVGTKWLRENIWFLE